MGCYTRNGKSLFECLLFSREDTVNYKYKMPFEGLIFEEDEYGMGKNRYSGLLRTSFTQKTENFYNGIVGERTKTNLPDAVNIKTVTINLGVSDILLIPLLVRLFVDPLIPRLMQDLELMRDKTDRKSRYICIGIYVAVELLTIMTLLLNVYPRVLIGVLLTLCFSFFIGVTSFITNLASYQARADIMNMRGFTSYDNIDLDTEVGDIDTAITFGNFLDLHGLNLTEPFILECDYNKNLCCKLSSGTKHFFFNDSDNDPINKLAIKRMHELNVGRINNLTC